MHAWAKSARPHRNDLWRLDCLGAGRATRAPHLLALSVLVWRGKGCSGVHPNLGRILQLRSQPKARPDGSRIWQVDGLTLRSRDIVARQLLALPMRMRNATGSGTGKSGDRSFGIMWLHDRAVCKEAPNEARHGRQQAPHDLVHDAPALPQSQEQGFSPLRWPRHSSLCSMERFRGVLGRYGVKLSRRFDYRACGRKRPLRAGQLHLGSAIRAIKEQASFFAVELQ